eukprot:gene19559-22236_t
MNVRGVCYDGPHQSRFTTPAQTFANSYSSQTCSYNVTLPGTCTTNDARYTLVDQMPLAEHFVQNAATLQPTDKDKDYEYAIRAAFREHANVTIGMYISREAPWNELECGVKRETLYTTHGYACGCLIALSLSAFIWTIWNSVWTFDRQEELRYLYDFCGFLWVLAFLVLSWYAIKQVEYLFDAAGGSDCTDPFTRESMQQFLQPANTTVHTLYLMFGILSALIL